MKAIVVREAGGPERLETGEVVEPEPGPNELKVAVEAAGLNFIDVYHRNGLYAMDYPFTPGVEGAGTVTAVGRDITGFEPGDRVGWVGAIGSYAQQHVIAADNAIPIPDGVETRVAAALLLQGITAHYLSTDTFPLSSGDTCLVHAGAGGVGLLLTQIAAMKGARVITTVGTNEKADLSREAGADHVIRYTETEFGTEVERLVGPNALDVVYDGVGAATFERSLDLLRPRGMMVAFGNASGPPPEISPLVLMRKGSLFLTRPTLAHYVRTREELISRANDLFGWLLDGGFHVRIGREYPLEQAADAHRALEGRLTTGKVLIIP